MCIIFMVYKTYIHNFCVVKKIYAHKFWENVGNIINAQNLHINDLYMHNILS
jgi:hypothetical protein